MDKSSVLPWPGGKALEQKVTASCNKQSVQIEMNAEEICVGQRVNSAVLVQYY